LFTIINIECTLANKFQSMAKLFQFLFFATAVLEIVSQVFGLPTLHILAKPLLVIFLGVYYQQSVSSPSRFFLLALSFCWAGDVFLLFDHLHELYFMAGLGSFLVAHCFFILSYRQMRSTAVGLNGPQRARLSFPVLLAGTGLITILYPSLGGLKVPVMIYAFVLTVMVLQSIFRYGRTSGKSFWLIASGATSFMLSDSLLAINKFSQPIPQAGILVMTTYIAAIYLITQGAIVYGDLKK